MMKTTNKPHLRWVCPILGVLSMISPSVNAMILNAPSSGSFTMNLDRTALAPYSGYFLSTFWDTPASDYHNPINTGEYFSSQINNTEISGLNRVFNLTAIGDDPGGQANQRFVKATSANFFIDTQSLTGVDSLDGPLGNRVAGAQIGMTGVQGFYAPDWQTVCCGLGGGLVNGDFSVVYDTARQTGGRSGWYLANNLYFSMAVYDFSRLSLVFADADNWRLSGDLLMSPENGAMLRGETLNDVGDFCLGVGAYSGCGQVSEVPLPGALGLFGAGLLAFFGGVCRKARHTIHF